jgi:membrane peptidoglycan carboxypeptidase
VPRVASRLLRLVVLTATASALLAGTVVGISFVGDNLVHKAASASELPLPPITRSVEEGSTVYADDGKTVLAVLQDSALRKPVALSQVSPTMITAVLDTEDHRFYLHGGFDIYSTVRALSVDSSGSGGLQGGSTIAQQLVKQLYLTPSRTISRKIKEAVLADRLEQKYSKNQILQAYLNTIYLGDGAYGIEAAAERYFGENARHLSLPQAALLAGLIQNPSGYNPAVDPVAARNRRSQVLSRMLHYGDITPAQYAAADATALPTPAVPNVTASALTSDPIAQYYVNEVKSQLLAPNSPLGGTSDQRYQEIFEGGLKIYTNFDPSMQAAAEAAVAQDAPNTNGEFEEAMVAIDPATGKVRALVGGPGGKKHQFDVITQGTRQPGSGFKLFTLLAALQQGYSPFDTIDGQGPCSIVFPGVVQTTPIRNDANGAGTMSVVAATANSVNCAFIRLAHEVGLPNVINMAHQMGITASIPPYPSIVIGAQAVRPLEMAAAYATVAAGGIYHTPTFIDHIVDRAGDTIYQGQAPGRRVISEQVAAEATVALQAVVQYGTGTAAALYNRPVAGKTGTTNNDVDAWFNGFTPQLEATVWMGNEQAEVPMQYGAYGLDITVFGATYPAPTWRDFAAPVLGGQPVLGFPQINYALLPPTKYITSPSLVQDDLSNHNAGNTYQPPTYTPYRPYSPIPTYQVTPVTPAPAPTPVSPPTTAAPKKGGKH